jgi:putative methionine-R-sulfoxide reductase with GAF domain
MWQPEERASSDLATLRESLVFAERRAATLAELTALMSEGRDPLALAQRSVELTARATRAAGAFVYLWDAEAERLVLQVGTEGWQRAHLGRIQLRMGEGITGWSALMRQTVVIPKDHLKDPRSRPFPELHESSFKSMIAVPIVAPGEEVLGVFSLYAPTEDAFTSTDVNLASEVGSLLASGLIQAETVNQLRIQSAAARFLRDLPDEAWGSLRQCLQSMARQCAVHLEADVCMIELATDRAHPHGATTAIVTTQRFRDSRGAGVPDDEDLDRGCLAQLLEPLSMQRLRIPLAAAAPIGAVTCYRLRPFTAEDELLLEAIGTQAAAGVLSLSGTERIRPAVSQLLSAPDPATTQRLLRRFGWRPHPASAIVLRIHPGATGEPPDQDDDRVRTALVDVFGADGRNFLLLGGQGHYLALAEGEPASREPLIRRISDLGRQPRTRLTAGIGPAISAPEQAHAGIQQALVAAQWAELAALGGSTVVRYEDVAHLRQLPSTALEMSVPLKTLLDALGAVMRYDLDNGTDLAQTLDALLANSGSVTGTSSELFIHRNTLRQRLQRIEELIGQSPEHFEDAVIAGLAARLINRARKQPRG